MIAALAREIAAAFEEGDSDAVRVALEAIRALAGVTDGVDGDPGNVVRLAVIRRKKDDGGR